MESKGFSAVVSICTAFVCTALLASAAQAPDLPYLVKDMNRNMNIAGVSSRIGGSSHRQKRRRGNALVYLIADDGNHDEEIWKSDGTAEGTVLVKDNPVSWGGDYLTNANSTFYFQGNDGVHGWEIWTSDGTAAGTRMVKDINPGGHSYALYPLGYTDVNGTLYFYADDGVHGAELWTSDRHGGGD